MDLHSGHVVKLHWEGSATNGDNPSSLFIIRPGVAGDVSNTSS